MRKIVATITVIALTMSVWCTNAVAQYEGGGAGGMADGLAMGLSIGRGLPPPRDYRLEQMIRQNRMLIEEQNDLLRQQQHQLKPLVTPRR